MKLDLKTISGLFIGLIICFYYGYQNYNHYNIPKEILVDNSHDGHDHVEEDKKKEREDFAIRMQLAKQKADSDTTNAEFQLDVARALHIKNELKESLVYYKRYESITNLSADISSEIGGLYWKLQPGVSAVKYFVNAIKLDSLHVGSLFSMGIVSLTIDDKKVANSYFKKVIRIKPNSTIAKEAEKMLQN